MAKGIAIAALAMILAGCRTRVAGDLPEPEAGRVVTVLGKAGIPATADREAGGRDARWSVSVQSSDATRARDVLAALSLPRPAPAGFDALIEAKSLVPSASREQLAETVALGEEVEAALEAVEGGVDASVIIARPGPPSPGGASPFLRSRQRLVREMPRASADFARFCSTC